MTRINTNVSSIVGRNNLVDSNNSLNQALTRLSTGLRINTGADDPAGLIASERLRSDITSIEAAITNTERATQAIATADSALSEVSDLLNDIRGLITESANDGALSADQIAANQLQIDSSLEAINRISQTTTFQGNKLLDGSLDFLTTAGANFAQVADLNIDQANLGTSGSISVAAEVTTAATQASVSVTGIAATTAAAQGVRDSAVTANITQASGTLTLAGETFNITALAGQNADGAEGNDVANLAITFGAGSAATSYTAGTDTLNVSVTQAAGTADIDDIIAAINGTGTQFTAALGGATGSTTVTTGDDTTATFATSGGQNASTGTIRLTTDANTNDYNATDILIEADSTITVDTASASYDSANDLVRIGINGEVTYDDVINAINNSTGTDGTASLFNATLQAGTGTTVISSSAIAGSDLSVAAASEVTAGNPGGISEDLVFELSGENGAEVFTLQAGTSLTDLVSQVNLVSDGTGVSASGSGTTLTLTSTGFGSAAFVDLKVIEEGGTTPPTGTFTTAVSAGTRATGADVVAKVNGIAADGVGNGFSINTSTLDLGLTVASGFTGTINFTINGGGALFQLGPDVVSNQQARLGIGSVNTAQLGGASGGLYRLQSGGSADLNSDATTAAAIVEESIDQITSLRGRLGAFQATTLASNQNALNSTLSNITEAESQIRDADFAAETAELTRSQILVQSGTRVLAIANQNPQNVLALLG